MRTSTTTSGAPPARSWWIAASLLSLISIAHMTAVHLPFGVHNAPQYTLSIHDGMDNRISLSSGSNHTATEALGYPCNGQWINGKLRPIPGSPPGCDPSLPPIPPS